jgi:hypothetical protein
MAECPIREKRQGDPGSDVRLSVNGTYSQYLWFLERERIGVEIMRMANHITWDD